MLISHFDLTYSSYSMVHHINVGLYFLEIVKYSMASITSNHVMLKSDVEDKQVFFLRIISK